MAFLSTESLMGLWLKADVQIPEKDQEACLELEALDTLLIVKLIQTNIRLVSLSMAHAGKDTGGSQFFLVHAPQPHLDGVHTVFGKTDDMKTLLSIANGTKINSISII